MSEIFLIWLAALGVILGSVISGFATNNPATIRFKGQQNKQLFTEL